MTAGIVAASLVRRGWARQRQFSSLLSISSVRETTFEALKTRCGLAARGESDAGN
jgi:hypothetical protein